MHARHRIKILTPRHAGMLVAVASIASGWRTTNAQDSVPPARPLGGIVARVADSMHLRMSDIRVLSDGRVFVDDQGSRRVLLFDSTLQHAQPVVTTAHTGAAGYPVPLPARPAAFTTPRILAYPGDTTVFLNPGAQAMVVIDPAGRIVRAVAFPTASLPAPGTPGRKVEAVRGSIIYTSVPTTPAGSSTTGAMATASAMSYEPFFVTRLSIAMRTIDTITFTGTPVASQGSAIARNALPGADAWAVLADGTVGVIGGRGDRIDWFGPARVHTMSPTHLYGWRQLTDSAKAMLLDSVRVSASSHQAKIIQVSNGPTRAATSATADAMDLASFSPIGGALADADGNFWVQETPAPLPGNTIWDVVSRQGALVDRVQLLEGMSPRAFGPGVVYLAVVNGSMTTLVKARIR